MGTRATWGFALDGEEYLTYNHFDGYPDGLGLSVLNWLRGVELDQLREQVRGLRLVGESDKASGEDVARLADFADLDVSTGDPHEWYVLLRETQGNPDLTLRTGVMIDSRTFPLDSLFCEWAYVIDLDHERIEVYRGFQQERHMAGRFADRVSAPNESGYWPVRLVAAWAVRELPEDAVFVAESDPPEEDED